MIAVKFINKAELEDSGVQFALEAIPGLGDEIVLPGPIITRVVDKTWRISERGVLQVDCFYYEMEDKEDELIDKLVERTAEKLENPEDNEVYHEQVEAPIRSQK